MTPVTFGPEAEDEVAEAAFWYEAQRKGLAARFLAEVHAVVDLIPGRPKSFPRLMDPVPDLEIRRALLRHFPYAIVFIELEREIRILAVCHAKRRPGYWIDRVKPADP